MPDTLTPAELAEATGKARAAQQAVVLARRGVPFVFLGNAVRVARAVAQAHALLPERRQSAGVDFSAVR